MIVEQRRFEIHMRRHLAAGLELPNGDTITVVAMHAAGGKYKNNEATRTKNAKALERRLTDPDDRVWSQLPIEAAPYRDVSDHLLLWAEVALPKPEPDEGEASGVASP